ncbi:hypothetical protein A9R05_29885 [Burkholderia sp. KK1]|nr:hypothetical protein A9R05_29885 [Burkholderia sp. KK1]
MDDGIIDTVRNHEIDYGLHAIARRDSFESRSRKIKLDAVDCARDMRGGRLLQIDDSQSSRRPGIDWFRTVVHPHLMAEKRA